MTSRCGRIACVAIALWFAWPRVSSAQLLPSSDEFLISAVTESAQVDADIAPTTPGNFVVTWTAYGHDGDMWGIFTRRFAGPALPIGGDTVVNSYTIGDQVRSAVATTPTGEFVVVWDSYYQDGSYTGAFAQRFSSGGAALGTEFQVSSQTIGYQSLPVIAADASGFVIVWEEYPDPVNNGDTYLMGRRYDTSGTPVGTEFQINSPATGTGQAGSIVMTPGGFIVTWGDQGTDGSAGGVLARSFDDTGAALGTEFVVNSYTTGFQGSSDASVSADGSFVVVWSGRGPGDGDVDGDGGFNGVFGQRYDSTGLPLGSQFRVNAYTSGQQGTPSVSASPTGEFVVTWHSVGQDGSGYGIFARAYKADGTPETGDVQVNQYTADHQTSSESTFVDDRTVVIVWQSIAQDGSFAGVYGRAFRRAGDRISGKKLGIKASVAAPSRNGLTFVSKDPGLEMPQAAFEDPRCPPAGSGSLSAGARLRVVGTGGDFTIDLPCVNWSANATGTRYHYRDGSGATCQALILIEGRLMKAICKGPQIAYSLGTPQSDVYVTLSTGDPASNKKYCASFGPQSSATIVRDGSDGRSYRAVKAGAGVCP